MNKNKKIIIFSIIIILILVILIGGYFLWQSLYKDIGSPILRPPEISFGTKCRDTDGGKDPLVRGEISLTGEKTKKQDVCVTREYDEDYRGVVHKLADQCSGEQCFILELYCIQGDRMGSEYIQCLQGCKDGVCNN